MPMNIHPLQRLYNDEIDFSISTFLGDGFDLKLSDRLSGQVIEAKVSTFDEAMKWLQEQAKRHFSRQPEKDDLEKQSGAE